MAETPFAHYNNLRRASNVMLKAHSTLIELPLKHADLHSDAIQRMRDDRARDMKLREGAERHAAGVPASSTG